MAINVNKIPQTTRRLIRDIASGSTRVFYGIEGEPYGWRYAASRNWVRRVDGTDRAELTGDGLTVAHILSAK